MSFLAAPFRHLLDPVGGAFFLLLASLIAGHYGRVALARGLVAAVAMLIAALYLLPVSAWIVKPLENSYDRPQQLPTHVDGIVVLSGGLRPAVFLTRGIPSETVTTLRIAAGAEMARRYPNARVVYSGVATDDPMEQAVEVAIAESMFVEDGVAPGRVRYERRSLDTWQNLTFSKQMMNPGPGETWVLVTSALHMRRSMGIARRIGWIMVPWPSDYETATRELDQPRSFPSRELVTVQEALHEWIGLVTYALEDRLR